MQGVMMIVLTAVLLTLVPQRAVADKPINIQDPKVRKLIQDILNMMNECAEMTHLKSKWTSTTPESITTWKIYESLKDDTYACLGYYTQPNIGG
uniref:Gsp_21 putative toxin n=1 Tax=Gemmula speciosa TaxID=439592 RepID=A0A098LW89_GEMSP